jgi:hypothetical protein
MSANGRMRDLLLTGLKAGSLALVAGVACSSVLEAG